MNSSAYKVVAEWVSLERYSHGGDVFTGEGIGGVADQQTGLTHSPEEGERRTSSIKRRALFFSCNSKCVCVSFLYRG